MAEPASWREGGDFGFKAEMLLAVPGTLAWCVVYFFLVTTVMCVGGAHGWCFFSERWHWGWRGAVY